MDTPTALHVHGLSKPNSQDGAPDIDARKNCISGLIKCAQMCQMSSAMMSAEGQYSKDHCKLCATVCDSCAQECDKFKDDHCKKCATECRTMSNM